MIGADEFTISTKHGVTVSVSSNKALVDFALEHIRAKGYVVEGSFVDADKETIRKLVWEAWANFKA